MFSGKSTEGSKRITKELYDKKRKVVIFTPKEAEREVNISDTGEKVCTGGKMVCRNGKTFNAIEFPKSDPEKILIYFKNNSDLPTTVVIEEAHFCASSLVQVCKTLAEDYKLRVIVIGLDQTFDAQGFGPIPALMVEAEFVTKELAVCVECGSQNASKSWLDTRVRGQLQEKILVGDDQYIALCRHCWKKYKEQYNETN
jgi:thymidine kinase